MPLEPSLTEVLRDAMAADRNGLMTATVGRVETYDSKLQVADVQPVIRHAHNLAGEVDHDELPVLPNIPVIGLQAGGFFIHFPLKKGDHVLLVFLHESIAMWRETGSMADPGDLRRHHLSHAVCIPGIAHMLAPLLDRAGARVPGGLPIPDAPIIGMPDDEVVFGGTGFFRFGGKIAADPVALSTLTNKALTDIATAFNGHKHPTGVGPSGPPMADPAVGVPLEPHETVAAKNLKSE
jgi:hypothetical protein